MRHGGVAAALLFGLAAGLALLVLHGSNAVSYVSDRPETCINCHVMVPQYVTWRNSSHRRVAVCNDCHVPHDSAARKYAFKAMDGARHATVFTLRREPQVIRIKAAGRDVVQENCRRCHMDQVHTVSAAAVDDKASRRGEGFLCWGCHREVPHGRVHALASTPNAFAPRPATLVPEWMIRK